MPEPSPTPLRVALRRAAALTTTLLALAVVFPATASAAPCWQELVNDYWLDNRVDRTYPLSCYREAMSKLPRDVQEYSDVQDDLRRALLTAIRDHRDSGGGPSGGAGGENAIGPGLEGDDEASSGFISEVLSKLGPKNADSIPIPLLVLGSIALLLVAAAGISYAARYWQSRRVNPPPV